jgi:AraC-like DNA-binding protein
MRSTRKYLSNRLIRLDSVEPRDDVLADVISATLLRNVVYRRIEGGAPWGFRLEQKARAAFYVVARGSGLIEVDGQKPIALSSGDVVLLPQGAAHVLRDAPTTTPEVACQGTHARGSATPRIGGKGAPIALVSGFFELGGTPPPLLARLPAVVCLSGGDPAVALTVQQIITESTTAAAASILVVQRLADVLFVQVLRWLISHKPCKHGVAALADPAIHRALAELHGSIAHDWTVAELAKHVGLSRSGFAARFASAVGEPPLQYLARWRIARAAELLRGTDQGIAEIAAQVGYESVPSFTRAFKRWQGENPGAYRKLQAVVP